MGENNFETRYSAKNFHFGASLVSTSLDLLSVVALPFQVQMLWKDSLQFVEQALLAPCCAKYIVYLEG